MTETVSQRLAAAMAEVQAGRWSQASAALEEVLQIDPAHSAAREQWAIAQFQLGRVADAVADFRRVPDSGAGSELTWNNLGVILETQAQYAEAAECYRKALDHRQPFASFRRWRIELARRSHSSLAQAARRAGPLPRVRA